jgi:glycosyltransferase involved in cell wall biosynthesis
VKTLIAVPWDQEFGGVASVVGNLARYLDRHGHEPVFLHVGESERPLARTTKWGFDGYELNLRSPFIAEHPIRSVVAFLIGLVPTLYRLGALLVTEHVEVVNVHYPIDSFVYFAFLRWVLPIRLVISVHGADLFPIGAPNARPAWPLRLMMRSADAVVAPSRAFLADCLALFPGASPRATAIHNGIDLDEFPPADPAASRAPSLLCIAAHNEKKGLDVLLHAFARIAPKRPELRLQLAGDGPLRGPLEDLARKLSLEGRVEFLGWRGRAEVAQLLRRCRAFVLPSRSEPFGMVVAEALVSGCPVVASAVGGIAEIVEDGKSGLLVPPEDPDALARALERVLDDDAFASSIAATGQARALARFGCDQMGANYVRLYADLLRGQPPREALA